MGAHAVAAVMDAIRRHTTTLVFVNTRAQAEIVFQALWRLNDETLAIALHHGSLAVEQRRKVEARWRAARCAPWSRPRRSISASTGRGRPGDPDRRAKAPAD